VPNAAPFLASPLKRAFAGAADAFVYLLVLVFVLAAVMGTDLRGFGIAFIAGIATATYVLYHSASFWYLDDATPGMRVLNMRMVRVSGGRALSLTQTLIRPAVRPLLLWVFAGSAYFLDWRSARVQAALIAPLLLELGMMFTLPSRQTLSDLVAKTLVVNVPPPQPHRAPAGPMYSPTDAEFGLPPGGRK
jgi:uncharacterized RDD family membrane protein YckC